MKSGGPLGDVVFSKGPSTSSLLCNNNLLKSCSYKTSQVGKQTNKQTNKQTQKKGCEGLLLCPPSSIQIAFQHASHLHSQNGGRRKKKKRETLLVLRVVFARFVGSRPTTPRLRLFFSALNKVLSTGTFHCTVERKNHRSF